MRIGNLEVYGVIYKIENTVNKKIYIGQTTIGFKKRYDNTNWWEKTHNKHLKNSVKKYGIKNFNVIEVFDVAFTKQELDVKESVYIDIFDTCNRKHGYNKKSGGANGRPTEETLKKQSKSQKGRKASEETKRKMSKSRIGKNVGKNNPMYGKNPLMYLTKEEYDNLMVIKSNNMKGKNNPMYGCYGKLNPFYGKTHTNESRTKISERAKERYKNRRNNPNSKSVKVYDTKGNYIEEFDSYRSCSEWLFKKGLICNIRTGEDAISKSVKNNKSYKGFLFNILCEILPSSKVGDG